ncbi:MAG: TolC family protein [Deltaproteobacteria bacterium]|nr:TolC family protein [Deltaproteobacteria bacterium]
MMKIVGLSILSFWLILLFIIPARLTGRLGHHGLEAVAFAEELEGKATGPSGDQGLESQSLSLSLRDFINLVREKNERIIYQQLESEISSEVVKNARSIFEPEFVSSFQHEKNRTKNTRKEALSQFAFSGSAAEYDERNNDYSAAIEGLVATGGRVSIGYTLRDISNSLQSPNMEEFKSFLGVTFTQPLLKNGGKKATMANIHVAEVDQYIAFQTYRHEMMRVVANAASAYWELYLAQEEYKVRKESVRIAEQILKDNRERVKTGKMAETEVLEAEAGLAIRRSMESAAKQDIITAVNNVRSFISSSAAESMVGIVATDLLKIDRVEPDFDESLQKALKLRADYLSNKKKAEEEGIRMAYAENQRRPQLNLKTSYGFNGLGDSAGGAYPALDKEDMEYVSWSVGVELRVPLTGGIKSRSELKVARYRKKQALLGVRATEMALANSLDTSIWNVQSINEQVKNYRKAVDHNKRLLDVELTRLKAGKSDSRIVLEREEALNTTVQSELESHVNLKKAILEFEVAEGTLLKRYGIEIMEEEK